MATGGLVASENNHGRLCGWGKVRQVFYGGVRGETPPASAEVLLQVGVPVIEYPDPLPLGSLGPPVVGRTMASEAGDSTKGTTMLDPPPPYQQYYDF